MSGGLYSHKCGNGQGSGIGGSPAIEFGERKDPRTFQEARWTAAAFICRGASLVAEVDPTPRCGDTRDACFLACQVFRALGILGAKVAGHYVWSDKKAVFVLP